MHLPSDFDLASVDVASLLQPGVQRRHQAQLELKDQLQSLTVAFLCDHMQWPKFSKPSGMMMTLKRHMVLWSDQHGRPATRRECLQSLGILACSAQPVVGDARCPCDFLDFLAGSKTPQMMLLAGNGMSLPTIGAWFWYGISSVGKRSHACKPGTLLAEPKVLS